MLFPAYLATGNYNIIEVNLGVQAASRNHLAAVANTRVIGRHIADLIIFLVAQTGARRGDFHLIGHGLGAHTAGFAGKRITGVQVGRITGLCYWVDKASFGIDPLSSV
jgi:pancreatic triacylglycerol lipase